MDETYMTYKEVVDSYKQQLADKDEEIKVLKFRESNVTTERDVANKEIERISLRLEETRGLSRDLTTVLEKRNNQLNVEQATLKKMRGALEEISKGQGRFSLDHFEHCRNTVEDMKVLAEQALADTEEEKVINDLYHNG